jgi:hypothetical protein
MMLLRSRDARDRQENKSRLQSLAALSKHNHFGLCHFSEAVAREREFRY